MVLFIDMPSFDVVSKPDLQEIDNAINNTKREVDNRFDFKNSNSKEELKKKTGKVYRIKKIIRFKFLDQPAYIQMSLTF